MPKLETYSRALTYSYAPGLFPTLEALRAAPERVQRVLVHTGLVRNENSLRLEDLCTRHGIRIENADHLLRKISGKENCYAAAVFSKYRCTPDPGACHVVLHDPSDMGNLGTILRTCLGFGIRDVIVIEPCADLFDPRVVRASMGSLFSMRPAFYDSFDAYQSQYPDHSIVPFMLDGSRTLEESVGTVSLPWSLVFGNEGSGLPAEFQGIGTPTRIVHSHEIDSLNLAAAVSIALYAFSVGRTC